MDIVTLSLDADAALVPQSAKTKKASFIASFDDAFDAQSGPLGAGDKGNVSHGAANAEDGHSSPDGDPVEQDDRDPDDFVIMNEQQAKRIIALCEHAFDVELSTDVVIADANVSLIAKRIMGARSLITGYSGGSGIAAR